MEIEVEGRQSLCIILIEILQEVKLLTIHKFVATTTEEFFFIFSIKSSHVITACVEFSYQLQQDSFKF